MRTTTDPKEYTIRIRINDEMYRYINGRCRNHNTTVSGYIRDIIKRDIEIFKNPEK